MSKRTTGVNDKMIKKVIMVYNAVCVFLAGYVVVGMLYYKMQEPGKFVCNVSARVDDPEAAKFIAWVFWVFYAQKFWEFCDTWFFILRRSFRQVTFLHIFHHSSITFVVGTILKFDYSGDMFLPIFLNALVHVLMYSHYLVTALGIKSWWRQYLTSLQLAQFCLISLQSAVAYSRGPSCGAPDWAKVIMILYMCSMLFLFGKFFVKRYIQKDTSANMDGVITTKAFTPEYITYQGTAILGAKGTAKIELPLGAKTMTSRGSRVNLAYQLTAIGASMPGLFVESEVDTAPDSNQAKNEAPSFSVSGGKEGAKVSWQVACERVERPARKQKSPLPCCPQQQ
mmetsp:Transcript_75427/g.214526  ORF Transcript_75427/g.214526 Transcript_75427/m.214526 type:complete len:339 (-) Transcript_75427:223-1239(-)